MTKNAVAKNWATLNVWSDGSKRSRVYPFPLSKHSSGRYLIDAAGNPHPLFGEAAWMAEVQLTAAQFLTYINDRVARGINIILVESAEAKNSSQSPVWKNANGDIPWTTTSPSGTTSWNSPVANYWNHFANNIVAPCAARGVTIVLYLAYAGFAGAGEGWSASVTAANGSDLQTFGAYLANLFSPYKNIILALGGDDAGDSTYRTKEAIFLTGYRSVTSDAMVLGHQARTDGDAYDLWGPGGTNLSNWINTIYTGLTDVVTESATAWARSTYPFFHIEGQYEGGSESGVPITTNDIAAQFWQSRLGGAWCHMFGGPMWDFGAIGNVGAATVLASSLNTPGIRVIDYARRLLRAYSSHLLAPSTGNAVITTSKGTGKTAICPALATDGTFAIVWVNTGATVTLDKSCMTHTPIRVRWYDTTNGTFLLPAEGSSFSNSGTQTFAYPGSNSVSDSGWLLVID